ncbi:MAG: hypothetical protein QM831_04920 [Kofleriaceae bacterium]
MNRRVLLIDSDPAFRDTLTRELARYKVVVMTEPEADRALALANSDAPALVLLCIEEADKKAGFRVFEKFKKGALSKVPLILVTGSMPADSFAKHRNLKVHADEYIDKRTMSTHELVGKIDGLIALGDPDDEEDSSIPVEDEIPMEIAEGDVVLDEVVGDLEAEHNEPAMLAHEPAAEPEENHDFDQHEARTVGPQDGLSVDSVVEAETDAAFDALMGGAFGEELAEPSAQEVAEAGEHREQSTAMPPVEPEHNPVDAALSDVGGVVPEPILDGRGRGTTPPPLLAESVPGLIIDRPAISDDHHGRTQAIAPIRDVEAEAEAIPEPVEHLEPALPPEFSEPAPEPVIDEAGFARHSSQTDDPIVADALSGTVDIGVLSDLADAEMPADVHHEVHEEPVAQHTDVFVADAVVEDEHHSRLESQPAIAIDDDELIALDEDVPVEVVEPSVAQPLPQPPDTTQPLPPIVPANASAQGDSRARTRAGSESHPSIDLGLDVVAERAESEQSGVYDRRALRKIGELERQISQLKTELERARAAGETAAKGGREAQFLHLRESMLAKDKELKQLKADLAQKDEGLAEANEKLRQAVSARTNLEQKQAELEKRATDEGAKAQKLAASGKATENQVAQLQGEVDRLTRAANTAETARQALEKDLATERATGKASASEAERLLRTEREQLVQRHQQELKDARAEGETQKTAALAQLRDELETAHGSALEEQIENLRKANAAEHEAAVAALEKTHSATTVSLAADHAGEQSRLKSELGGQITQLEAALGAAKAAHEDAVAAAMAQHSSALEQQAASHAQALAKQKTEHAVALEEKEREHAAAIADKDKVQAGLLAETTQAAAQLAGDREKALADLNTAHAVAIEEKERDHEEAIAAQQKQHVAALAAKDDAAAELVKQHRAALADKDAAAADLEKRHRAAIAEMDAAAAEVIAQHREAVADLEKQHRAGLSDKDAQIAELEKQRKLAIADVAAAKEAAASQAEQQVADANAALERARAGHENALDAKDRQLEEARGQLIEQHRGALAELRDKHEAELAKAAQDREALAEAARRAETQHRSALAEAQQTHQAEVQQITESAGREVAEHKAAAVAAKRAADDSVAKLQAEREEADKAHVQQVAEVEAKVERQLAIANGEFLKQKSVADAEHKQAIAAASADAEKQRTDLQAEHSRVLREVSGERDELKRGLSSARDSLKRSEGELASAVQSIADRNAELRQHASAIAERDQRIAELRKEIEALELENTGYQDQVLKAYQKIKTDEAMVARARKAMAIALTVLDDQGNPKPPE